MIAVEVKATMLEFVLMRLKDRVGQAFSDFYACSTLLDDHSKEDEEPEDIPHHVWMMSLQKTLCGMELSSDEMYESDPAVFEGLDGDACPICRRALADKMVEWLANPGNLRDMVTAEEIVKAADEWDDLCAND